MAILISGGWHHEPRECNENVLLFAVTVLAVRFFVVRSFVKRR